MIRPLGIAEVGPACREGVRSDGRPDRIGEVGARLDRDRSVRGPRGNETEAVGPHSETGREIQNDWVRQRPERSGITGKNGVPASGARKIIDGYFFYAKTVYADLGSVAAKIKSCEVDALSKGVVADAENAAWDGDGGQVYARRERSGPNVGDGAAEIDMASAGAALESTALNVNNAAGNFEVCKAAAGRECTAANGLYVWGDYKICQACAQIEGLAPDLSDAITQHHTGEIRAIPKQIVRDAGHAARRYDVCKRSAVRKRAFADVPDAVRESHGCQAHAVIKSGVADGVNAGA